MKTALTAIIPLAAILIYVAIGRWHLFRYGKRRPSIQNRADIVITRF